MSYRISHRIFGPLPKPLFDRENRDRLKLTLKNFSNLASLAGFSKVPVRRLNLACSGIGTLNIPLAEYGPKSTNSINVS